MFHQKDLRGKFFFLNFHEIYDFLYKPSFLLQYNIDYRKSPGSSRRWRSSGEARSTASSDNESMYSSSMSDGLNKSSCSNKQFSASNTSLDRQPSGSNLDTSSHWSFTTSLSVRFTYWQRKFRKCGYNQISREIYINNPCLFHQG